MVRLHAWEATPLGPLDRWPVSLRVTVGLCLNSPVPMAVYSGADLRFIYNDAFIPLLLDRHPGVLGQPAAAIWPEAWPVLGPQFAAVLATGQGCSWSDQRIDLIRDGRLTEAYFQYSFTPIHDESGRVAGIFNTGTETTARVRAERQLQADEARQAFRTQVADSLNGLGDPAQIMARASELLGRFLSAARVCYAEIDEAQATATFEREWNDGTMPSIVGVLSLNSFGPIVEELKQGRTVCVTNVATDPRTSDPASRNAYEEIGLAAFLSTPLIKDGRLVAALGVNTGVPRVWSDDHQALVHEVAERIWAAVERARAEAALRQNEARFATALTAANLGTFEWNLETDAVILDDRSRQIFGFGPGEGTQASEIFRRIDPAELDSVFQKAQSSRRSLTHLEIEYRIILPDGAARFVASFGDLFAGTNGQPDRMRGVFSDITIRKQAEERDRLTAAEATAAAETNAKFRALFEQGGFFAAILGLDGTVHEVNRVAAEGTGFGRDHLVGKRFWDCGPWSPRPSLVAQMKVGVLQAASGLPFHVEMPYFTADSGERHVSAHLNPVTDAAGQVRFVVATGMDITDRKQAEDSLRTLAADLSEADHRKDEFLAMLAHELRNPLGAISGAVQLAGLTDQPTQLDEFRDLIQRQVVHLTRLIDDLLDVSRITQGKITLQPETVDLATIVRRAVELVQAIMTQKRHTLTVTLPAAAIAFVADPTRAEQILGNLLTNAAKYTEPGGRIDLDAGVQGKEVVFRVRDTGVGIAPAMLPEVFGLFTQVDATIDRAQGGLGIGLTLVRNLVEMHGGQVFAASAGKGHGSEFTVRLPIGQPSADASPAVAQLSPRKPDAHSEPRTGRILVVDDNLDTARLTARMLRLAGFEVATAHDGLAAVDLAHRLHPTVVLLDIGLPGMNGYEVAAALRHHESCADATIIAISGYGEEKARERSEVAGFNHHLTKPVDFNRLMSLIEA